MANTKKDLIFKNKCESCKIIFDYFDIKEKKIINIFLINNLEFKFKIDSKKNITVFLKDGLKIEIFESNFKNTNFKKINLKLNEYILIHWNDNKYSIKKISNKNRTIKKIYEK